MNILPTNKRDFIENEFVARSVSVLFAGLSAVLAFFIFLAFMWSMFLSSSISSIYQSKEFYKNSLKTINKETKENKTPEFVNAIYASKKGPVHEAIFESLRLVSTFDGEIFLKAARIDKVDDKTVVELELEAGSKSAIVNFIKLVKAQPDLGGVDMEKVVASISRNQTGAITFSLSFNYNSEYDKK